MTRSLRTHERKRAEDKEGQNNKAKRSTGIGCHRPDQTRTRSRSKKDRSTNCTTVTGFHEGDVPNWMCNEADDHAWRGT